MKILLLGEYSNLHWTLAEGLRLLGHDVTVTSDGDGFKNYKRDIDISRKSSGLIDTFDTIKSVIKSKDQLMGYDIVQIINPCFTQLNVNINKYLYKYLKRNNGKIFLGAFGIDSFWIRACLNNQTFRYSEFFVNGQENRLKENDRLKNFWLDNSIERFNKEIAETCDGIIACLYEYYTSYKPFYGEKVNYIPLPVNLDLIKKTEILKSDKIRFFIGINKDRSEFKGTNLLFKSLLDIERKYADNVEIIKAESLPYNEYMQLMSSADVVLDQAYSYTPAMNALLAMGMGKVVVGGGESEMYDLLGEKRNRPIINVYPSEEDIFRKLENLVLNSSDIPLISENSRAFVQKHHEYIKVANEYINIWTTGKNA